VFNVLVLPGDGVGREVTDQGVKIIEAIGKRFNRKFNIAVGLIGGCGYKRFGDPLPEETLKSAQSTQGILMGAVGSPEFDNLPRDKRPEKGLLRLRKELNLYGNIRPVCVSKHLVHCSPLKRELVMGIDIMIIRELTGGIYFGHKKRINHNGNRGAVDVLSYKEDEIKRILKMGFERAQRRRKNLVSVDKENVLESSKLWREIANEMAKDYPDVSLRHMYVDNCSMQLILNPKQFDVIVTENMFGDILSDEAAVLSGSIGMLPSASIGDGNKGLYEPVHGSAPIIAGKDIANPIGTILSVAMMLDISFDLRKEGETIRKAVEKVLSQGYRTKDLAKDGNYVSCSQMGDLIYKAITA
jgi:3-isopropylmalate dehydrogenase